MQFGVWISMVHEGTSAAIGPLSGNSLMNFCNAAAMMRRRARVQDRPLQALYSRFAGDYVAGASYSELSLRPGHINQPTRGRRAFCQESRRTSAKIRLVR